ncbi:MAG: OmpA family protein [Campylobacterota bacterium]|nr:OmpA family protein [Campylobacterota bacterium]
MEDRRDESEEWMGITDLMSGLMLIFLLIAITFMFQVQKDKKRLEDVSKNFIGVQMAINKALQNEFTTEELKKWNVSILPNNTIRFKSPDVLFKKGESELKPLFQFILEDFFPRYIKVLTNEKFINHIDEVRVEGHTSSNWNSSKRDSYIKNLELSQKRAKEVLTFIINRPILLDKFNWLTSVFRANGLSSSKLIYKDGVEDKEASRRVEFRVMTKSLEAIRKLEELRNK